MGKQRILTIGTKKEGNYVEVQIIALAALIAVLLLMPFLEAGAVDYDGPQNGISLIGATRLTPESSYVGVPELLEKYIKETMRRHGVRSSTRSITPTEVWGLHFGLSY